MTYYKIEMYNHEKGFYVFITITARGLHDAKENAEYLLEQMWKDPDEWMIDYIIEEKNF